MALKSEERRYLWPISPEVTEGNYETCKP